MTILSSPGSLRCQFHSGGSLMRSRTHGVQRLSLTDRCQTNLKFYTVTVYGRSHDTVLLYVVDVISAFGLKDMMFFDVLNCIIKTKTKTKTETKKTNFLRTPLKRLDEKMPTLKKEKRYLM